MTPILKKANQSYWRQHTLLRILVYEFVMCNARWWNPEKVIVTSFVFCHCCARLQIQCRSCRVQPSTWQNLLPLFLDIVGEYCTLQTWSVLITSNKNGMMNGWDWMSGAEKTGTMLSLHVQCLSMKSWISCKFDATEAITRLFVVCGPLAPGTCQP